jgi:hypothetical protein
MARGCSGASQRRQPRLTMVGACGEWGRVEVVVMAEGGDEAGPGQGYTRGRAGLLLRPPAAAPSPSSAPATAIAPHDRRVQGRRGKMGGG